MFDFIKRLFTPQVSKLQSSALIDDRPLAEKRKDFRLEEMTTSLAPVDWKEKSRVDWRKFPIFDQNGSGSCVAQTGAKLLGINYWLKNNDYVHFSATDIYQRRYNRPQAGMNAIDALDLTTSGVTLEELVRSQGLSDAEMDNMPVANYKRRVGDIFKVNSYVTLPTRDIETVASTIQKTGKGVMVWFYFRYDEWTNEPTILDPNLPLAGNGVVRHSVTAVDFGYYKGKKGIIIEDSWGAQYGWAGQRFISEEFFNKRNFYAGYILDFKFNETRDSKKPQYRFTDVLMYQPRVTYGNKDVIALQDCLKYTGNFPLNIESTGWYGGITVKAVKAFQSDNGLEVTGIVDQSTLSELNKIFA